MAEGRAEGRPQGGGQDPAKEGQSRARACDRGRKQNGGKNAAEVFFTSLSGSETGEDDSVSSASEFSPVGHVILNIGSVNKLSISSHRSKSVSPPPLDRGNGSNQQQQQQLPTSASTPSACNCGSQGNAASLASLAHKSRSLDSLSQQCPDSTTDDVFSNPEQSAGSNIQDLPFDFDQRLVLEEKINKLEIQLQKKTRELKEYKDMVGDSVEKKRKRPVKRGRAVPDQPMVCESETTPLGAEDLSHVDRTVFELSDKKYTNVTELLQALIDRPGFKTELHKARVIFTWLTTTDRVSREAIFQELSCSPNEDSQSLNFSKALHLLYTKVGLRCERVSGQRAAHVRESDGCVELTHWWNAVQIGDCQWYLVDAHCAAALADKKLAATNSDSHQFFFPDPEIFIASHYPTDTRWQLVAEPWSLHQFETQVPVKAIFKTGCSIVTHGQKVKPACDGTVTIRLECFRSNVSFTFSLSYDDGRKSFNGLELNRFGMHYRKGNMEVFTIRPPEKGRYRLIIASSEHESCPSENEDQLGVMCEYDIICERTPTEPLPYPGVNKTWGAQNRITHYSLTPQEEGVTLATDSSGCVDLSFGMQRPLRLISELHSVNGDGDRRANILQRTVNNAYLVKVAPPAAVGEFGLTVYANDPAENNDDYLLVYQYLITCTQQPTGGPLSLPNLRSGYLGKQPAIDLSGMSPLSNPDPYLTVDSNDLQVTFQNNSRMKIMTKLGRCEPGCCQPVLDRVLLQSRNHIVSFSLKLPQPGLYRFEVYGMSVDDHGENIPNLFNYLIHYTGRGTDWIFPKQLPQWRSSLCYLHEPLSGVLAPPTLGNGVLTPPTLDNGVLAPPTLDNGVLAPPTLDNGQYKQRFRIEMPEAEEIMVIFGSSWTPLKQLQPGLWQAEVSLQNWPTVQDKLYVSARSKGADTAKPILGYCLSPQIN